MSPVSVLRWPAVVLAAVVLPWAARCAGVAEAHAHPGEVEIRDVLPLGSEDRKRLAELVRTDPEARALFDARREAVAARLKRAPRPLEVIHYEGLVNTDPRRVAAVENLSDMDDLAALLEVWQVTGDEALATRIREYVAAWSAAYRPTGNDVNENKLMPVFVAYAGLRATFPPELQRRIDAWLDEIVERQRAVERREWNKGLSNRFTKRVRLIAMIGLARERADVLAATWTDVRGFVERALRADGTSYDLELRDSLTYHTSALVPVIDLAMLASREGVELYRWSNPSGGSIARSVEFVLPFARGEKTRAEWVNSKVELDRKRAAAGIAQYQPGRTYEPRDAVTMLEAAEYFDPSLAPLIARLRGTTAARFPTWRTVVNAACRADAGATLAPRR